MTIVLRERVVTKSKPHSYEKVGARWLSWSPLFRHYVWMTH